MTTIRVDLAQGNWPKSRILILDFDFFHAIGGGQTFYRRMIERHPEIEFHYPSRGPDYRTAALGGLPSNARPFVFDAFADIRLPSSVRHAGNYDQHYARMLVPIAAAIQGSLFDVVEVPSFFPVVHLVRPVLGSYGSVARRVSLGLLGWLSVSLGLGYEGEASETQVRKELEKCEANSVAAADALYTISELHCAENRFFGREPVVIDIHNTLEEFPLPDPAPPSSGPPDLWYVGRLDRAKGPDLFLEMAARVSRKLYRGIHITGPDNKAWSEGPTWSDKLLEQAARLKLDITYHRQLSDTELRAKVYRGRNVLVIPSRTDAFNYVALEALVNGCPILLSRHTGAAGFFKRNHSRIMPHVIEPENVPASAAALGTLLRNYEKQTKKLRRELIDHPFRSPEIGFMNEVFDANHISKPVPHIMAAALPLLSNTARLWRPRWPNGTAAEASIVVTVRDATDRLAATLASLARQTPAAREVIVVDDGSYDAAAVRKLIADYAPVVRLIRKGRQGEAYAGNTGWMVASQPYVALLRAGEILDPKFLGIGISALQIWVAASAFLPRHANNIGSALSVSELNQAPGLLIRRSTLSATGGFDVSLGAQSRPDLLLRLRALGPIVGDDVPRPLAARPWGLVLPPTEHQAAQLRTRALAAVLSGSNSGTVQSVSLPQSGGLEDQKPRWKRSMA
jgi:glycosyltransferase involved in cell wall biosynthesis